jgi:hypothetical protein
MAFRSVYKRLFEHFNEPLSALKYLIKIGKNGH